MRWGIRKRLWSLGSSGLGESAFATASCYRDISGSRSALVGAKPLVAIRHIVAFASSGVSLHGTPSDTVYSRCRTRIVGELLLKKVCDD